MLKASCSAARRIFKTHTNIVRKHAKNMRNINYSLKNPFSRTRYRPNTNCATTGLCKVSQAPAPLYAKTHAYGMRTLIICFSSS